MSLAVYNSLSRTKEEFIPLGRKRVKMYVCGVTLYDELHLGHARYAVAFDMIRRYLRHKGYQVDYVTNFTDIDDKMIARAQSLGISTSELAQRFMGEYFVQMNQLGVIEADSYPRATEHIREIVALIKKLEDKELAYSAEGNVFFRVKRFPSYGKLSHQNLEDVLAGVRVEINDKKEDAFDFALWKKRKKDEPSWDSPWGKGRPAWHIECSAMAIRYLGETLDIHGGGRDLVFPHHENEIAQSEGATGETFVRYWLHNGLVRMKNAKMAKSTGNVLPLSHALSEYREEAIRYFLLSAHYRNPLDYDKDSLKEATTSLERVYTVLRRVDAEVPRSVCPDDERVHSGIEQSTRRFVAAMDDDFNTPGALGAIFEMVKEANLLLAKFASLRGSESESCKHSLVGIAERIRYLGSILGLFQDREDERSGGRESGLIDLLVSTRDVLRQKKEWELADGIRDELDKIGIELEDGENGTTWRAK